jgi:hypothetical protein
MEFLNKQPKSTVLPRTIGFWAAVAKFDACPKDGKLDTGCSVILRTHTDSSAAYRQHGSALLALPPERASMTHIHIHHIWKRLQQEQ